MEVAMKHYAMSSDDQFQKAAGIENGGSIGGSITGGSGNISSPQHEIEKAVFHAKNGLLSTNDSRCREGTSGRTKIRTSDLVVISDAL